MVMKMNLWIITKNHAADPELGFLTKSISKPGTFWPEVLEQNLRILMVN